MKAEVIKIGNSQGIRIPKPLLEQCGFGKTVRLEIHENKLVISSDEDRPPRAGWAEAFAKMAEAGDDAPLLGEGPPTEFDLTEWEW